MSLAKATLWNAAATLIKIGVGLLIIKLLALSFGPAGVGQAGNFRQLVTVLGVLAGAGIANGVTTFVARAQPDPAALRAVTGTAVTLVLLFSGGLAILLLAAAAPISQLLFGHADYQTLIRLLALVQLAMAWASLSLAILKGLRDARGYALSLMVGSVLGLCGWWLCYYFAGFLGALLGLALIPALAALPASVMLWRQGCIPLSCLQPRWHAEQARLLGKFTLMTLITAVTLPLAWIMMRNLLATQAGWAEVGIWQGVSSISDVWLQFITGAFSVWLLPTLAKLTTREAIAREILRTLKFVVPLVCVVSLLIWLLRDWLIWLLFSAEFNPMRGLFAWQLAGDVLKVGAYIFGYLVIVQASLRFYLLAELSQFVLLTSFAHWLIPGGGALGAAQAYMATYSVYFLLCGGLFLLWRKRA